LKGILPVPRLYAAAFDPAKQRSHLLLEDLTSTHRNRPAPLSATSDQLRGAVECLAYIHASWSNHPDLSAAAIEREEDWIAERMVSTQQRLTRFLAVFGNHLPEPTHAALATAARTPLTAVQGDDHLLDWEGLSIEPGPHDLASLIALHLPVRERQAQELVERYAVRPRERGVARYDQAACWDDYRRAIARPVLSPAGVCSPGTPARA